MNIKQEDLIRFWNWCGLVEQETGSWYENKVGGKYISVTMPTLTLDHINKFAIPKLNSKNMAVTLIIFDGCRCLIHVLENGYIYSWDSSTPTEALYNAIMKVIDKEKEK